MTIDTTAASNPAKVARVLNIIPHISAVDPVPVREPSAASKCPDCGFTILITDGCSYCGGHDAPAK